MLLPCAFILSTLDTPRGLPTNTENGIISSPSVEKGFRAVDRRFFVPKVSTKRNRHGNVRSRSHMSSNRFVRHECLSLLIITLTRTCSPPPRHSLVHSVGTRQRGVRRSATSGRKRPSVGAAHLRFCSRGPGAPSKLCHILPQRWFGKRILDLCGGRHPRIVCRLSRCRDQKGRGQTCQRGCPALAGNVRRTAATDAERARECAHHEYHQRGMCAWIRSDLHRGSDRSVQPVQTHPSVATRWYPRRAW